VATGVRLVAKAELARRPSTLDIETAKAELPKPEHGHPAYGAAEPALVAKPPGLIARPRAAGIVPAEDVLIPKVTAAGPIFGSDVPRVPGLICKQEDEQISALGNPSAGEQIAAIEQPPFVLMQHSAKWGRPSGPQLLSTDSERWAFHAKIQQIIETGDRMIERAKKWL
jgi:hypothetical protein